MLVNFPDVQSSNWYGKILSVRGDRWSANKGRVLVHLCLAMSGSQSPQNSEGWWCPRYLTFCEGGISAVLALGTRVLGTNQGHIILPKCSGEFSIQRVLIQDLPIPVAALNIRKVDKHIHIALWMFRHLASFLFSNFLTPSCSLYTGISRGNREGAYLRMSVHVCFRVHFHCSGAKVNAKFLVS